MRISDWSSDVCSSDLRARYGDRYRIGRYYAPRGWSYGYSRFSIGIFLNSLLYSNSYWIDDPYSYRLPPAYGTLRRSEERRGGTESVSTGRVRGCRRHLKKKKKKKKNNKK